MADNPDDHEAGEEGKIDELEERLSDLSTEQVGELLQHVGSNQQNSSPGQNTQSGGAQQPGWAPGGRMNGNQAPGPNQGQQNPMAGGGMGYNRAQNMGQGRGQPQGQHPQGQHPGNQMGGTPGMGGMSGMANNAQGAAPNNAQGMGPGAMGGGQANQGPAANSFGPWGDIFGGREEPEDLDPELESLLERFGQLSPPEKAELLHNISPYTPILDQAQQENVQEFLEEIFDLSFEQGLRFMQLAQTQPQYW